MVYDIVNGTDGRGGWAGLDQEEERLQMALQRLAGTLDPYAVYLFGSSARKTLRPDSDVDIAFLADGSLQAYPLFLLAQDMAAVLDRDVDLVDLGSAETVFRAQVVSQGRQLLNRDPARVARFEMRVLKEYALLNDERACVLEKVLARRSV